MTGFFACRILVVNVSWTTTSGRKQDQFIRPDVAVQDTPTIKIPPLHKPLSHNNIHAR